MNYSTAGRFDNAPAHIIIISNNYATSQIGAHENREMCDDDIEARKEAKAQVVREAQEARRVIYLDKLAAKAEIRKVEDLAIKAMRTARSEANRKLGRTRKKHVDEGPYLDTNQCRRKHKVVHKINPLFEREDTRPEVPNGYQALNGMKGIFTVPCMILAINRGHVQAVKIGRRWYVDTVSALAYVSSSGDRKIEASKASLRKARAVRHVKKSADPLDHPSMESIQ